MYPGTRINEINDGRIHAKRIEGKHSEFIIVDEVINTAEVEPVEFEDLGLNKEYGFTIAPKYKTWKKKRKGKRYVYYATDKEFSFKSVFDSIETSVVGKKFKRYMGKITGSKKPRGKRCKEFRRIIKFHADFMKNNYTDYTKCSTVVDMTFPGDDTVYKYHILKPEDNAKFEAVVTKRIDELKGEE